MIDALDIHVKGLVQGVGFRPFVYRLAKRYLINGWVMNANDGVHIRAEGESDLVDQFVLAISNDAPSAAKVTEIDIAEVPIEPYDGFEIRFSDEADTDEVTLVSPDMATCEACTKELFDGTDRRYHYPFINCTDCGPRFTIIDDLPYDRPKTSMRDFEMCEACAAEYGDPSDRRFHAQPDACFDCGPHLWLATHRDEGEERDSEEASKGSGEGNLPAGISEKAAEGYSFEVAHGREETDAVLAKAVDMLLDGRILAIKGLGGYHLACDATDEEAVAELRRRKHRNGKPFAVMMRSLDDVRRLCDVSDEEAALLSGSVRPIVLLRRKEGDAESAGTAQIATDVAPDLPDLGVMLPYTPVQHLLMNDLSDALRSRRASDDDPAGSVEDPEAYPILVMTSGNMHDEPIAIDDDIALEELSGIADAFLGNDRRIVARFDDSVVRVIEAGSAGPAMQVFRRARGYAPAPLEVRIPKDGTDMDADGSPSTVFAAGPEQKNTFTFLRRVAEDSPPEDGTAPSERLEAFVSQHIGDMENADSFDAWLETKARYEHLFDLSADALACDMHPEYITTKWARERAAISKPPEPLVEIQHHHAHVVSVIGENSIDHPVCGIAFDGTGFGVDGNIWGGEFLVSNLHDFERFANFAYVPMPGGSAAVRHPLQMAFGALWSFDLLDHPAAASALEPLGETTKANLETMIEEGINCPVTSSVGRLFDAVSALLGICTEPTYEGEPAILLEAELWRGVREGVVDDLPAEDVRSRYAIEVVKNTATASSTARDTSVVLLDASRLFEALLDDLAAGVPRCIISKRFHDAFVDAMVQVSQLCLALYELGTVTLSGGVFMNRYLIEHALDALERGGFTVAINRDLPPNDGCASYGEAVVTYARLGLPEDSE